ncbi:ATP-dependent helicase [Frondihabitans sp. 762G35]|uniref:ATP-dependent helicase n=1 Tax=Frondihabitans sp. 762G35 TaxID=1446794 RepID=UPI001F2D93C1|nr:ATP-dependent DNA helicase [Frondihabitans sp. 762G35]
MAQTASSPSSRPGFLPVPGRPGAHPGVRDSDAGLDPSQLRVLALADGECAAVIGAPGSGKTAALVEFVVDRVHREGWGPSSILALAPTRSTATRLRDVLAARLDVPTPGPLARTVASLAFDVVGHAARVALSGPPTLLTGGEQDSIIRALLDGHVEEGTGPEWPEKLGPSVRALRGFRTELRELLMRATEHGVDADGLRRLGRQTDRPEWVAAADFSDEYHRVVDDLGSRALDAAELVDYAVAALDRGETAPVVDGLRVVVVDDAQEATESTLSLLRALVRRGVAVVAFGDPDLATNAFRGGSPDVLGRLAQRLGIEAVTTIHLESVHRHAPRVRALVSSITDRIGTAGAGRQHAARSDVADDPTVPPLWRIESDTPAHEIAAVGRALREHHLFSGVPWSRMLVVVRNGALVPSVARSLQVHEVPTRTPVAGRAVRDEYGARHLLLAASVATGRQELAADVVSELLSGPLAGFDALSLRRLRLAIRAEELAAGGTRSADALLVEALSGPGRFATIDSRFAARAGRFATSLDSARAEAVAGGSIEEVLWGLWERSGLARDWSEQSRGHGILAAEADRHLDGVVALFTAAKRFVERSPEADARSFLDQMLGADVPEDTLSPQALSDSVLVTTPSGAIGLEVDVVAVVRLQDGIWPNLRVRGGLLEPDGLVEAAQEAQEVLGSDGDTVTSVADSVDRRAGVLSDELRMFALATSRATRQVILSATVNDDEAPSMFLRLLPADLPAADVRPPLSLRGLVGHLRHAAVADPSATRRDEAASALARLATEEVAGASPDEWYGLLAPSTEEPLVDLTDPEARVAVSPSQIGSFEECPLHWFIDRFGGSAPSSAMGLGTVIHDAMEHAVDIDPVSLWASVEARWGELEFESAWMSEAERKRARTMTDALASYLRDFVQAQGELLGAESSFQVDVGQALLRGTVDRVEGRADGAVVIVDLKTGKSVPTVAEGATNPQLASYQLALAEGGLEAAPSDSARGGAKLLFVAKGTRGKPYSERWQEAFGDDDLDAFRQRVRGDAAGMADRVFLARVDDHCTGRFGGSCSIHVVGEVTQ